VGYGKMGPMPVYEAFLSYAHYDNHDGRVSEFRDRLEKLLFQRLGRAFTVFQDTTGLDIGSLWEEQIATALDSSVVLIALITPSFFNREWCRREVETFLSLKPQQGKPAIIIPIYWLEAPLLDDPAALSDHPIAPRLTARQYDDWTEVFAEPIDAPIVRKKLDALTKAILKQLKENEIPVISPPPTEAPKPIVVTPRPKARVARLEVTNVPTGASLTVNGVAVAGLTYQRAFPAGENEHAVEVIVSAPGYRSEEWDIVLVPDHPPVVLEATLERPAAPVIVKRTPKATPPAALTAPLTLEEYKAQLVTIPAGSFVMGGEKYADEKPPHRVTLSGFQMGRTPVTVGMWQEFCKAQKGRTMPELPDYPVWEKGWDAVLDHPIVKVSWNDCKAYSEWAGLLLPTEAQWEYASRGGLEGKEFPWGNEVPKDQLWWQKTRNSMGTAPVQRKNNIYVNGYGLVDMSGNVLEWCADWFGNYAKGDAVDPSGPEKGKSRILRASSWYYGNADYFRCAYRSVASPDGRGISFGFRLSQPLP